MNPTDHNSQSNSFAETVLDRVFSRVAPALTNEDMRKAELLNQEDPTGNAVKYFLLSKVPNFDVILQEEIKAERQTSK